MIPSYEIMSDISLIELVLATAFTLAIVMIWEGRGR